jgi:hypothetical protein
MLKADKLKIALHYTLHIANAYTLKSCTAQYLLLLYCAFVCYTTEGSTGHTRQAKSTAMALEQLLQCQCHPVQHSLSHKCSHLALMQLHLTCAQLTGH